MYSEGMPEFVVEQGLYYPTIPNYGYISTGLESPAGWDDHHRIFGMDGQDVQYPVAQTESFPYVYYTPSYEYLQSLYNPYNPYIPGPGIGVDGQLLGAQQYYTIPSYDNSLSPPPYLPVASQPVPDANEFKGTSASTAHKADNPVSKHKRSSMSANNPPSNASRQSVVTRSPEGSASQGRGPQVTNNVSLVNVGSEKNQLKGTVPPVVALSSFRSSANRRSMDKVQPKFEYGRVQNEAYGSPGAMTEQNRGPRTNKMKNQFAVKAYTTLAGDGDDQGNIIIDTSQYNKDDFPVDYANARFFVIKSYSEDDVHKSIKYNVWSSTSYGNNKLNIAFEDAQKVAALDKKGCPIFLFFSVNTSGQFCGIAEMTGPVNFYKDMDFWQQDKWSGCFPVKWHIIKDVPHPNFRRIILENNEHKPVTSSRDTQEILYKKGMDMLQIFKNYTSKTSILDDFMYYENRQKIMQEEKARRLLKNYGNQLLVPIINLPGKKNIELNLPSTEYNRSSGNGNFNLSGNKLAPTKQVSLDTESKLAPTEKVSLDTESKLAPTEKVSLDTESKLAPTKQVSLDTESKLAPIEKVSLDTENKVAPTEQFSLDTESKLAPTEQVSLDIDSTNISSNDEKGGHILKIGSISINSKWVEPKPLKGVTATAKVTTVLNPQPANIITVGSLPVKVDGFTKSSGILTVGTIPIDTKSLIKTKSTSCNGI